MPRMSRSKKALTPGPTRRALAALVLVALSPMAAFGQAQRAGVVTTLEGNVTARRAALPDPVPLKFKDDVFVRDRVVTGDRSLARLLLGGKAVVTVRERSSLMVTEVPGRSTVDLDAGKVGLAVARDRMRPGEVIDIRTPNAIVAVRGTALVAEVRRATAQAGGAAAAVTTAFYLLRGIADATRLDPATGAPIGTPQSLGVMTSFTVTGTGAPIVAPIPPEQVAQITSGLQPSQPQHTDPANEEQLKQQVIGATNAVLAAVTTGEQELVGPRPPRSNLERAIDPTPIALSIEGFFGSETVPIDPVNQGGASETAVSVLLDRPEIAISGNLFLDAGVTLKTFQGSSSRVGLAPLILVSNPTLPLTLAELQMLIETLGQTQLLALAADFDVLVAQLGADDLIEVPSGALVTLATLLLKSTNATIAAGDNFLRVDGALTSTAPGGLLAFDPSAGVSSGDFLLVDPAGSVSLAGPAIDILQSVVSAGGHLVHVTGGRLTGTALLRSQQGTASVGGSVVRVDGGGAVALTDAVAVATSTDLFTGGDVAAVLDATLTSASPGALLRLAGALAQGGGRLLSVAGSPSTFATVVLAGGVLQASGSDLFLPGGLVGVLPGGTLVAGGAGDALALLAGGTHALGVAPRSAMFALQGRATALAADPDEPALTVGTDQPIQTARVLLDAVGAAIATRQVASFIDQTLLAATTEALFRARGGATLAVAEDAIELTNRARVVTAAPVLALNASSFTVANGSVIVVNNSHLRVDSDLFSLINGSTLTAGSASPGQILNGALVRVSNGGVLTVSGGLVAFGGTGGNVVNLTNGFCPGGDCFDFNGVRAHLANGASSSNVLVGGTPFKNPALGQINAPNDAHIIVDGPTSRVLIGGQ